MSKHQTYINAKNCLISEAKEIKRTTGKKDLPLIRQVINDQCDQMHRQIDFWAMKGNYSEAMANVYKNWLSQLVCRLHP